MITTGDTENRKIPNKVYLSTDALYYYQEGDQVSFVSSENQATTLASGYITKVDKDNITIDYLDASGTSQTITYNKAGSDFWDHQIRVIGS